MTTVPLVASRHAGGARSLRRALVVSLALHVAAVAALVFIHHGTPERPPAYRVNLIGAAGLRKQMGIVADQQPADATPTTKPAPAAAERPPEPAKPAPPIKSKAKPVPKPVKATPNVAKTRDAGAKDAAKTPAKAAPPVAGSGQKTGRGTDVTNMVADGIAFPYPVYLNNIVRQIKLNFNPPPGSQYMAELKFLIHRDGSVSDIQVMTPSRSSAFDREARGAVEAAGNSGRFGPLPSGFPDDVLPVFFAFEPDRPPGQ